MFDDQYQMVSEQDLIRKLSDTENNFIERKTAKDSHGWLKTAVAFANSCPVGQPGILYVGVDDGGDVIKHSDDLETIQKNVSASIGKAWPPIYFVTHILNVDGLEFIAVVIYGSPSRPHFSGPAYIRVGPESRDASEQQYDVLIAQRSSKYRALHGLIGQPILWSYKDNLHRTPGAGILSECTQFWIIVKANTYEMAFPLDWVLVSFEPRKNSYLLIISRL
jgi:Putative DNA-binding domain